MLTPTVQKQLKKIGYRGTDADLKTFQKAKGLSPTGVVDEKTAQALATVARVPDKRKDLFVAGMKGKTVATLEKQLDKLGFQVGAKDGVMDPKLLDAIVKFKKEHPKLGNIGRWAGRPVQQLISEAAHEPKSAKKTPSGLFYPTGKVGSIIGRPFQGTHTIGNWQSDNALDIAVPNGTPIYAVADGTIGSRIGPLDSSNPRFAGSRVYVDTPGNSFYYAHLSKLTVHAGQHVKKGDIIGYSGSANGVAHLHFGVEHGDPQKLFGV
ncbi:MAG: peptidoglycan DD-metalloendopeptidase family protein [Archangiaceae bacterium]|nr:peptidoglycan DD-metalloendopeptidase family protein [Archangiaceae bacterium]